MDILRVCNVRTSGRQDPSIMLGHGFGCDQLVWEAMRPHFEARARVVRWDLVGSGASDLSAYSEDKYAQLDGHAADLVAILERLGLPPVDYVGHSVGSMIAVYAAVARPDLFRSLSLLAPSPYFLPDGDYPGSLTQADLDELLDAVDLNYYEWSQQMVPTVLSPADDASVVSHVQASFCRTDARIARAFARVVFLGDHRQKLPEVRVPTLIVQCADDFLAPPAIGRFMQRSMPNSTFVEVPVTGHFPHVSAPEITCRAIADFLESR